MNDDRMLAAAPSYTWVHKDVFPGGLIPSVEPVRQGMAENNSLRLCAAREVRSGLRTYPAAVAGAVPRALDRGVRPRLRRRLPAMWEFYLSYSEAGFRSGYLKLHQLSFG